MGVFKSYDVRGIFPTELDAVLARKIGIGLGRQYAGLPENKKKESLTIVVGRDMRTSAPEMAAALIDGLRSAGMNVIDIGMVTTPCCYFAIERLGADGGIMTTASHNPAEYIGFKVCRELAIPISKDTGLGDIEKNIEQPAPDVPKGSVTVQDVSDDYVDYLVSMGKDLKPIRVAADASNGMAGLFLLKLFKKLPCKLEGMFLEPDGKFPNHEADPLKEENLADVIKLTQASQSAIGFCYDGDADRVAIVDEKGTPVGCDLITALLAAYALKEQPGKSVTYDLRSSKVVREVIQQNGGDPVRSRVGHAHVKQAMRKTGILCGGELSGHYYFQLQDKATFYIDSALVATIRLLNILSATGKKMSELIDPFRKYFHTGEINFSIADKDAALAEVRDTFSDGKQDELDGVTVEYPNWWFNARPSNTEPLLRLTLEGDSPELRDAGYEKVSRILNRHGHRVSHSHDTKPAPKK